MKAMEKNDNDKLELETLEQKYPQYDRTRKHWRLIGFKTTNTYPQRQIPLWRFDWQSYDSVKKYSGKKLRELRAQNGVRKIKATNQ